jgi:L-malate glycosyltransferase
MKVHQLLTSIVPGDAISGYAFFLQDLLRKEGFESEIFGENVAAELLERCKPLGVFNKYDSPDNILFVHYSIASSAMLGVPKFLGKKVIFYHNVTPYQYFVDINPLAAFHCLRGVTDLHRIAGSISAGVAFSEFSMQDLKKAGISRVTQLPLRVTFNPSKHLMDPVTLKMQDQRRKRVLMVGRLAPNKKIEDALRIVSLVRNVQLILIGSSVSSRPYYYALREMAQQLKVHCEFAGHVSPEDLHTYFRTADALLVTSEHEGFCLPILEAFQYQVPVIARAAGAIPETTGGGAILFDESEPRESVALLLERVLQDHELRSAITKKASQVLQEHLSISYRDKILSILRDI